MNTLELFGGLLMYIGGGLMIVAFLSAGIAGIMGWLDDKDDRG